MSNRMELLGKLQVAFSNFASNPTRETWSKVHGLQRSAEKKGLTRNYLRGIMKHSRNELNVDRMFDSQIIFKGVA